MAPNPRARTPRPTALWRSNAQRPSSTAAHAIPAAMIAATMTGVKASNATARPAIASTSATPRGSTSWRGRSSTWARRFTTQAPAIPQPASAARTTIGQTTVNAQPAAHPTPASA